MNTTFKTNEFVWIETGIAEQQRRAKSLLSVYLLGLAILIAGLQQTFPPEAVLLLCEIGLGLWVIRQPQNENLIRMLLMFLFVFPVATLIIPTALERTESWLPAVRYDQTLFRIDRAMGLWNYSLAQWAYGSPWHKAAVKWTYESLDVMLLLFYALALPERRRARELATALGILFCSGLMLYAVLPACGPQFAVPGFPWVIPQQMPRLNLNHDVPNCMPSAHLASILTCAMLARNGLARWAGWLCVAGTAFATLATGQHYVSDLVVGVPFACYSVALARRQWRPALLWWLLVLLPILALRFTS